MATSCSSSGEENLHQPLFHSESEWDPVQVASWLRRVQPEYEDESRLFQGKEESQPKGSLPGVFQSEKHMKVKITKKDKSSMTPEEKHLYQNKIKIIRKECEKRWPGNNKIYFRTVTDSSKPEQAEIAAESVKDISDYSAQLVCAVSFGVTAFRNLSVKKHLAPAAKILQVKSRGHGKYELANRVAIAVVEKGFVEIQPPVNYKDLEREKIVILTDLGEVLKAEKVKKHEVLSSPSSGSGSTDSVDETNSSPLSSLSADEP